MPPVSPQSSRTGLLTAVVIFVILFVTATIFAIYYGVDAAKAHQDFATVKGTLMPEILPGGSVTAPELEPLREARKPSETRLPAVNESMPLLTVAMTQRDELANLIDPTAGSAENAYAAAKTAMKNAAERLGKTGATAPTNVSLLAAYNQMANQVVAKQQQINTLSEELASAQKDTAAKVDELNKAVAATAEQVGQIQAGANEAITAAVTSRENNNQTLGGIEAERQRERQVAAETIAKLNQQLAQKTSDLEQMSTELAKIRERLAAGRVSVNEPLIKAADGTILRVPGANIVYISRGSNDQIVPGMTFEVFDRSGGVPRMNTTDPNNEDAMPQGKASLEVVRVGPTSSEARVTRRTTGAASIQEGDVIVNLVYDPNVKYNFVVYGKFNLDRKGDPANQDTEVIKQKITEWGGRLQDKIGINTDFLVVGAEPSVPALTEDEKRDPIQLQKAAAAQAEYDEYEATVRRAQELHVPILNQNRFLHLIGAYETITR